MRKRLSKKESWFKENNFTAEDEIYFGVDVNKVHYHVAIAEGPTDVAALLTMGINSTAPVAGIPSEDGLYFGTGKNLNAGTFFSGLIDDVRVYNIALSAQKIEALSQ